jgi:hypothetical protein
MIFQKIIKKIKLYCRVGELLHLIALISLASFIYSFHYTFIFFKQDRLLLAFLYGYTAYLSFGIFLFAELDARSRFQNFKQLRDQLFKYGYNIRIIKPMLNSRCQRDAAKVACAYFGFEEEVKSYFYSKGYRWYHIIPDFVFSQPGFLLTGTFWTTTFLVRTYKPEILYD